MRVMSLDVGSKTIGVAISDELQISAQGLTTLRWDENDMSSADDDLRKIIAEYQIKKIIVGLPKHMNGSIGDRGKISQIYANRLEKKFGLEVILIDERLTTISAERALIEGNMSRKKRKQVIDKMAAVIILQQFLEQQ